VCALKRRFYNPHYSRIEIVAAQAFNPSLILSLGVVTDPIDSRPSQLWQPRSAVSGGAAAAIRYVLFWTQCVSTIGAVFQRSSIAGYVLFQHSLLLDSAQYSSELFS